MVCLRSILYFFYLFFFFFFSSSSSFCSLCGPQLPWKHFGMIRLTKERCISDIFPPLPCDWGRNILIDQVRGRAGQRVGSCQPLGLLSVNVKWKMFCHETPSVCPAGSPCTDLWLYALNFGFQCSKYFSRTIIRSSSFDFYQQINWGSRVGGFVTFSFLCVCCWFNN